MKKSVLLDLLYPPRCPVCDRLVKTQEICEVCRRLGRPERVRQPLCMRCGKPLVQDIREYCFDCAHQTHLFTEGRAVFLYRGMEDAMHRFKNGNRREYAYVYGQELFKALQPVLERWNPEVLVPVPIHVSRRRKRGYNQAELLCRELSRCCGIPLEEHLLVRCRKTRVQRMLNDRERRRNVQGAFAVEGNVPYRKVLLVDDIYTTGSTADAASEALLAAGAGTVYCASICIGKGF